MLHVSWMIFFFFQAEDGIRDLTVTGVQTCALQISDGQRTTRRGPEPSVAHPLNTADALQAAFVTVAERVRPAVVHIGTVQVARARRPSASPGPFADDPLLKEFFDQFFGPRSPENRGEFHQPGLGSGVIVDSRGYVLTNFHVIQGADGVIVRLS